MNRPLEIEEINDEVAYYTLSTCQGCDATLAISKPTKGKDIKKNYLRISIIAILYTAPCVNRCACGFKLRFNPSTLVQQAANEVHAR